MSAPEALRFYAYVVVDKSAAPATPLAIVFSRSEGRAVIEALPRERQRTLRVRRAKVTLFDS